MFVTDDDDNDDDVDGWMDFVKSRLSVLLQSVSSFECIREPFCQFFIPLKIITRTNEKMLLVWS